MLHAAASTVYNAQRLNSYLAQHWQAFARQPYFDEQGVFISAVVSAPLLLTMFTQLVLPCISSPSASNVSNLHGPHVPGGQHVVLVNQGLLCLHEDGEHMRAKATGWNASINKQECWWVHAEEPMPTWAHAGDLPNNVFKHAGCHEA